MHKALFSSWEVSPREDQKNEYCLIGIDVGVDEDLSEQKACPMPGRMLVGDRINEKISSK
jgi:hypothetical protein